MDVIYVNLNFWHLEEDLAKLLDLLPASGDSVSAPK
jgi:hypothetical protein